MSLTKFSIFFFFFSPKSGGIKIKIYTFVTAERIKKTDESIKNAIQ